MSLSLPLLHSLGSPTKHRVKHRTALLALLALVSFTCYFLFVAYPAVDLSSKSPRSHVRDHLRTHAHPEDYSATQHRTAPRRKTQQQLQPIPAPRPTLSLSLTEELAAVSAFIAALPHNVLPSSVDPNVPLDPQLVLDFDSRGETAREELSRVVEQVWTRFPVMLYTKLHSSDSRELRHILANMHIRPPPLVIEVDQREDGHVLMPLLTRLTHVPSLPILLIGGRAVGVGTADTKDIMTEIRGLHQSGELAQRIVEAGSAVNVGTRKGAGNKRRRN